MIGREGEEQPLFEREYSDTLLVVMLKGMRPEKYRDRSNVKVEWDGDITKVTDAQLARMKADALAQFEAEKRNAALQAAETPVGELIIDVQAEKPE